MGDQTLELIQTYLEKLHIRGLPVRENVTKLNTLVLDVVTNPSEVKAKLKTLFINLPQRDTAGTFPPFGPLAVMTYLQKAGYTDLSFYNMDLRRLAREEALDHIVSVKPDILCISAPVSTSYENCRYYSIGIKKRLPKVTIVLGGNLAASAEIILRMGR